MNQGGEYIGDIYIVFQRCFNAPSLLIISCTLKLIQLIRSLEW